MNYNEYNKKIEEIEVAEQEMRQGKMSKTYFAEHYIGVPSTPLPEKICDIAKSMCDPNREAFGLTIDGSLYVDDYQVFVGLEDYVYVVFDTTFRGETDYDFKVVEFPATVFSDENVRKQFVKKTVDTWKYAKQLKDAELNRLKQKNQYHKDMTNLFKIERQRRDDLADWARLKKIFLKDEVPMIIDSLIKRGILESEHKDDYISFVKCDLI